MTVAVKHAPVVTDSGVTFYLNDPGHRFARVELVQELQRPRVGPRFARRSGSELWELNFERPDVARMEYRLRITRRDGTTETRCDPSNELRASGPLGDSSVIEWPDYEPPTWLGRQTGGEVRKVAFRSRILKARMRARLWSAPGAGPDDELPLLVVHDGPEYADHSQLLVFLDHLVAGGKLPTMRAALLAPVDRDHTYSASSAYGRALAHDILPQLSSAAPTPHGRAMRIGMGASLGALAMLHAHRTQPATFGGLFLQSGSYFRPRGDSQESGFVGFRRICRFAGRVLSAQEFAHPIPVAMTCGVVEENLANNRAMRAALDAQGYEVSLFENRDAHNWVAWRDALDPSLPRLLRSLWG